MEIKENIDKTVEWFAEQMKQKLYVNIHKGGWNKDSQDYFITRAYEEMLELIDALDNGTSEEIIKECADVASLVMFIADNVNKNG